MTLEAGLYGYLTGVSGVTDLIGTGADCRLYQDVMPAETAASSSALPAIVYSVTDEDLYEQFGANPTAARATLMFEIHAATGESRSAVSDALYAALERATGTWNSGVTVLVARRVNLRDDYQDQPRRFIREVEYEIDYNL